MAYEFYWKAEYLSGCVSILSEYGDYTRKGFRKAKKAFRAEMREMGIRKAKIQIVKLNYTTWR